MDHKTSENGSEIKPDLKSNPDEPLVKTIQQLNLEKGNRTRVSKTLAYSLLGILLVILIIVVFVLPSMVDETRDKVATVEEDNTVTTQIDRSVLTQKPIAQALFSELLIKVDELKLYGIQFWGGDQWSQVLLLQQDGDDDYQSAQYDLAATKYRGSHADLGQYGSQCTRSFGRSAQPRPERNFGWKQRRCRCKF